MEQNNRLSELLKNTIGQRYDAIALKMIADETEIPENAVYPLRDLEQHLALCQAFALSRREAAFIENIPHLPTGVYQGILTAPLGSAGFEPDVIVINCRNAELRTILFGIKTQTGQTMKTEFDAIDSCVWGIIPAITKGEYRVSFPDPGDFQRAHTSEDDVILAVPKARFAEFEKGLQTLTQMGMVHSFFQPGMEYDFVRPAFYNRMFKAWGLDVGKNDPNCPF